MKSKLILLILTVVFCQVVTAQTGDNHGLILRGTAYDGKVEMHDDYAIWRAKLRMEFVNEGSKPIILINPFTEYGGWKSKIDFIDYGWSDKSKQILFSKPIKQKDTKTQRLIELAEGLNSESPPQNFTSIIDSGSSLQFDDEIVIRQDKIRNERNKRFGIDSFYWEGPALEGFSFTEKKAYYNHDTPIQNYDDFKIKFETSLVKYQKNPDLLENLRTKWKSYGILPIDTNGGFTIFTETIKNIKYEVIDKTTDKEWSK